MATFNSRLRHAVSLQSAVFLFIFFMATGILRANPMTNAVLAAYAEKEFHQTQAHYQSDTGNLTNAWLFARACYNWADFAQSDADRAAIANQGIAACRQAIAQTPESAAAHYYLGMNLGQLARTELLGALVLVREMEQEFKTAATLDEHFDFAGPARNLGLLYLQAPRIGSIGNRRKAREFLERAANLAPDLPENHLNLVEAYLQWGEASRAQTELNALDALWPKAKARFTGEYWAEDWADWTTRRQAACRQLAEISTLSNSFQGGH